jgi:hypothetical protein
MRRAVYWTAVVVATAALVVGGVQAYLGYRATAGPDGTVKGYFAALVRSDAPAALGFGIVPAGPHDLLTSQVLAEQQQLAPLHDVRIRSVQRSGSQATVRYSYRLRFVSRDQTVTGSVQLTSGRSGWRMEQTAVPATIRLDQALDRSTFAGATVPDGQTLLFPGALPIRFDTRYLRLVPATAQARFGGPSTISLGVRATPAAQAQLTAALRKHLTACVTHAPPSASCPLPSARFVPGSLRGRLVSDLTHDVTFRVSSDSLGTIDATGSATFRGRYRELTYDNVTKSHRGSVRLPVTASAYAVAPLTLHYGSTP